MSSGVGGVGGVNGVDRLGCQTCLTAGPVSWDRWTCVLGPLDLSKLRVLGRRQSAMYVARFSTSAVVMPVPTVSGGMVDYNAQHSTLTRVTA